MQGDKNQAAIPRKCTQHIPVKNCLILSTFCFTVERVEREIDGKLFSIIERTTVLKQFCLNHDSQSKVLKSHLFFDDT